MQLWFLGFAKFVFMRFSVEHMKPGIGHRQQVRKRTLRSKPPDMETCLTHGLCIELGFDIDETTLRNHLGLNIGQ